jgi:hypothetical protein
VGRGPSLVGVLAAVLLVAASIGAPSRATAWTNGACPTSSGVTVVVDFSALGGGVAVRCAPGEPASGFAALTGAGFSIEQVRNVPGFLCRIDGLPGPERESCMNTPPATAHWSYWTAPRGGSWSYVSSGAGTRTPPPGSVEGWAFVDGAGGAQPPSVPPPAPPAPPATPRPTVVPTPPPDATPRPAPATPTAAPSRAETPSNGPSADPSAGPTGDPSVTAVGTATPTDRRPLTTPSAGEDAAPIVRAGSSEDPGGGLRPDLTAGDRGAGEAPSVPVGTILGAALVLGLGGAGALVARRRAAHPDA